MTNSWSSLEENVTGADARWRFSAFQLDVRERRLTRAGLPLALAPKAFDLLALLVERSGRLVRRQELMDALWPDTAVGDVSLARQVCSLRKTLGDSQREQRIIETVAKSGYRFKAPTVCITEGSTSGRPWASATMAVLPFRPLAGQLEPHLTLGLADALILRLSALPGLTVRPIHAARAFADATVDPLVAGRALRVESVLDSTLQRSGERLRLHTRLLAVRDGRTLWAQTFDQAFDDVFALQDAVATRVGQALLPALWRDGLADVKPRETRAAPAYELYLRGRYVWGRRTPRALESAVRAFDEALALDPGYAAAHAARADALSLLAGYGLSLAAFHEARASAHRALELAPGLADAHAALGLIAQKSALAWERAEEEYRMALQVEPRHLTALQRFGELLALRGRFDEGLQLLGEARRIDPVSPSVGADLAKAYVYARRYEQAARESRAVLEFEPSFARARLYLGMALMLSGERAAGLGELQAFALEEDSAYARGVLAWAEAAAGRPAQARRLCHSLVEWPGFVPPYALLLARLAVGDRDEALVLLERMRAEGHNVLGLGVSPLLDALRGNPRYLAFVERARLVARPEP